MIPLIGVSTPSVVFYCKRPQGNMNVKNHLCDPECTMRNAVQGIRVVFGLDLAPAEELLTGKHCHLTRVDSERALREPVMTTLGEAVIFLFFFHLLLLHRGFWFNPRYSKNTTAQRDTGSR